MATSDRPTSDTAAKARKTLVFIGGFEFPAQNAAATRIKAVARLFQIVGYDIVLIGTTRDKAIGPDEWRPVSLPDLDAEAWETGYPRSRKEWIAKILSIGFLKDKLKARYGDRLAGVVCYNFPALAQWDAARFARRNGAVAVGDISEWFSPRKPNSPFAIIKNLDTTLRMNWVNRRMDGLITSSPLLTRTYADDVAAILELPTLVQRDPEADQRPPVVTPDGQPKRLFFAGTGFDPELLKDDTEGLKDRLDWSIDLLAEAARRGSRFTFDIFGAEKDKFLAICPEQKANLDLLGSQVTFHGRQPWNTVVDCLRASDFSFFLRKATRVTLAGFPTKLTEAIAHAIPVITNPTENIAPYLQEGENSFSLRLEDREASVAILVHALGLPESEILRMKTHCRDHNPLALENFVDGARGLMERMSKKS